MGHSVRERPLQKNLRCDVVEFGIFFEEAGDIGEDFVEVLDCAGEFWEYGRAIGAAKEEGAGVAEDAVHVANEFMWSTNLRGGAEVGEFGRSVAESFLSAIGQGRKKVLKEEIVFRPSQFSLYQASCRLELPAG